MENYFSYHVHGYLSARRQSLVMICTTEMCTDWFTVCDFIILQLSVTFHCCINNTKITVLNDYTTEPYVSSARVAGHLDRHTGPLSVPPGLVQVLFQLLTIIVYNYDTSYIYILLIHILH